MNNIDKLDGNTNKYDVPPLNQENLIDKIPPEIFQKISSYLKDENIETSQTVSSQWNEARLYPIKNETHIQLMSLIHLIVSNLPEGTHEALKANLIELGKDEKILDAISLKQIKALSYGYKESLVDILKDLSVLEITTLESTAVNCPEAFKYVFKLARIYKDLALNLSDFQLAEYVDILLDSNFFSKVLEESNKILNKDLKSVKLISIITLLDFLPDDKEDFIDTGLTVLSYKLIQKSIIDKGLQIIGKITSPEKKAMALINTMDDLLQMKEYKGLLQALEMIGDHDSQNPECFYQKFDFNETLQDLSDNLAIKEPIVAAQILNMKRR